MCGILGCWSARVDGARFEQALALLEHRGPYARGHAQLGALRMGMTRLPMSSNQAFDLPLRRMGWLASYNGEIYDGDAPLSLAEEIGLLILALERGGGFPDGMYAFAMQNPSHDRLYLGRDVLGIKPLYYWHDQTRAEFAFASELPALLQLLGARELDRTAVADVVATGSVLAYRTMYQGVQLLPPGTLLSLDLNQPEQPPRIRALLAATPERAGTLPACLADSISRCVNTFRPVGLLLSGGVDSNLINSFLPPECEKFHVALADSPDSPGPQPGLRVRPIAPGDFWPLLRRAVRHFGAPTRMSSIVMYQSLAEWVRRHGYYCVLVGEGADELFWGYPRHLDALRSGFALTPEQLAAQYFGDFSARAAWLSPGAAADVVERARATAYSLCADGIDEAIWRFDLHYSLEPLLRRADHLLMAQTIEARLPFLHRGVPTLARALGRQRLDGQRQKAPLLALIRQRLPDYPIENKRHFRLPFSHWGGVVAEMRQFLRLHLDHLHTLGLERLDIPDIGRMAPADAFTLTTLLLWRQSFAEQLK